MVKVPPLRTRGFTLIELVVTLAIMALLLFMAVPLATDWTYSARTLQARGTLVEGFAQAKALALRNPCAAPNDTGTHAATLRATTDGEKVTLSVLAQVSESLLAQNDESLLVEGDGSCDHLSSQLNPQHNPQWSASLPEGVTLTRNGTKLVTGTPDNLNIDNRGLPMPSASSEFTLSRGGAQNDETFTLQ